MSTAELLAKARRLNGCNVVPTPAGARLRVSSRGRSFCDIEIDRWSLATNWPEPPATALHRLAGLLSWLYVDRTGRACGVGGFRSCGSLVAPTECVLLLNVLLSAEGGDDALVRATVAVLEPVVDEVRSYPTLKSRREAAAIAIDGLSDALAAVLHEREPVG